MFTHFSFFQLSSRYMIQFLALFATNVINASRPGVGRGACAVRQATVGSPLYTACLSNNLLPTLCSLPLQQSATHSIQLCLSNNLLPF